ncbi:MAG TPA: acetoacetate--CoA ligase, partial [Acidimicrobiales bacterium]|nr:acetoacetate--CoA ligase [Acidimicrobiales bacterium]
MADDGRLLWTPSADTRERARITGFLRWLEGTRGLRFSDYHDLWRWSVGNLEDFWASVWDFGQLPVSRPYDRVLSGREMPGCRWFEGAELNYVDLALRNPGEAVAASAWSETRGPQEVTFAELADQVGAAAAGLARLGVGPGDRVGAYLPNIPETLVAFLATASLGAIWSSCAPEFGTRSVLDRFRQIEPKVLLAVDGYRYGGVDRDRTAVVGEIAGGLPGLAATVTVPYLHADAAPAVPGGWRWADLLAEDAPVQTRPVPFDHPLWILYSSGTTGLPKAIVHGHGGMVLEHLKYLSLHADLGPGDRFFWFTTTGWMMWNFLISGLLVGATLVLYDGSPAHPDPEALWAMAEQAGITYFGTSAPFLLAQRRAGTEPGRHRDLSRIRAVGSTGSPLPAEGFDWVYDHVGSDLLLGSVSGGTDMCTAFVASCPLLPVHAGESQCRALGAAVDVYDDQARPVTGEIGELVVTEPMPCMPVGLWDDEDGKRYRDSYFSTFPGVWRHGDWARITERETVVITGRSDSTLNRGGVRMGTAEFYRVVEGLEGVVDSLVIDTTGAEESGRLVLFLVLAPDRSLDDELRRQVVR